MAGLPKYIFAGERGMGSAATQKINTMNPD
jgi:hypothetical protein